MLTEPLQSWNRENWGRNVVSKNSGQDCRNSCLSNSTVEPFFSAVFILVAVVSGILFGVVVLLLVYHARGRCKREKKPERTVPRVSFKIPPPKLEAFAITTQTRYPQQEQEGLEEYLDPEIYRYYEYRIFDTNDQRQQDRTPLTSRIKDSGVETGFT